MWGSMELPCCKNGVCPQKGPPPEGELVHSMEEGCTDNDITHDSSNLNSVDRHICLLGVLHQLPLIGLFVEFIFGTLLDS